MRKRISIYPLLISYFLMYFNTYFINPYLSLDSLVYSSPKYALLIASLIYISPYFAQFTTLYGFSAIAEKKHFEKGLISIGYSFGLIQCLFLLLMTGLRIQNPFITLSITFFCNLFMVAYIPAIKAYLSQKTRGGEKGKTLSQLNMLESLAWFFGMLLGGITYNYISLQYMIFIAAVLSVLCLILLPFTPSVKIQSVSYDHPILSGEIIHTEKIFKSTLSFKQALIYQFIIFFFASTFFGLIGAYQKHLGAPIWFYGLNNAIPGILGIIIFYFFGKILDRYGPDALHFYGWISYSLVFLGLLTQNMLIIFIVWIFPAYTFRIGTEYLASQLEDKEKAIRSMALAGFFNLMGIVLGGVMGGLITLFSEDQSRQFQIVLIYSFIGVTMTGVMYTFSYLLRKYTRKKKGI